MVKKPLGIAISALLSISAFANNPDDHNDDKHDEPTMHLGELKLTTTRSGKGSLLTSPNVSNQMIGSLKLRQGAATLGDAMAGELGIFSNHYGGGASAPIIRGQEGKRIRVLQNGNDVVDMSAMSPDHAVMVDATAAKAVQVLRGASSLLYGSGNVAGVVNVMDDKSPPPCLMEPMDK